MSWGTVLFLGSLFTTTLYWAFGFKKVKNIMGDDKNEFNDSENKR